jgi:hypothetical protein
MLPDLDAVTASYQRCRASEGFIDTFYMLFLGKSQEVVEKFRHTDFTRQKLMLRESLLLMLLFNRNEQDSIKELKRLGERHSRRQIDIPPHLYELWLDALCEAVEQHDPEFDSALPSKWRAAMRPGIELIISSY